MAEIVSASDPDTLERAARVIRGGGVVAIPTETFYGLAADATQPVATSRIFAIKGRPQGMALPLVAASVEQVTAVLGPLDAMSARAAKAFWPGPLSLVLSCGPQFGVTAGQSDNRQPATGNPLSRDALQRTGPTVAVRVPGHAFVRTLCERTGTLLTATSANPTGEPAAETAEAVARSLGSAVDLIVDDGAARGGMASTIADLRGDVPRLVRDGAIAWKRVLESL